MNKGYKGYKDNAQQHGKASVEYKQRELHMFREDNAMKN